MDVRTLLSQHFEIDQIYKIGFASIDIINSSDLKGSDREISTTKDNLKALIETLFEGYPVAILSWRGDGGIIICDGTKGYDILVSICDKIVSLLPYFNKARGYLNCLPIDLIHIRVVCHESDGVRNTGDPESFTSDALNDLSHCERDVGSKDHVVVTSAVYRSLSPFYKKRFGRQKDIKTKLGDCYILDHLQSASSIQINENKSSNIRDWIIGSVQENRFDQIDIFAYTNETLYTSLGPLPDCNIRVLTRNWITEEDDEKIFNKEFEEKQKQLEPATKEYRRPWTKSDIIKSTANILLKKSVGSLFQNIDIRFYKNRPFLKGAILSNSKTGHRAAHIGFYEWEPSRLEGGSPYVADIWSGFWLSEDQGAQSAMLNTIQSFFNEFWNKGDTFEDLKKEGAKKEIVDKQLDSLRSIWAVDIDNRYLIAIPGRKLEKRDFPTVAGEDLQALRTIEQVLSEVDTQVSIQIKHEPDFEDDHPKFERHYKEFKKRIEEWPGHIIYICHRTLEASVLEDLVQQGFPYKLEIDNKSSEPKFLHIKNNVPLFSPMDHSSPQMKDFCVISKCNRKDKDTKLFIVAGLHGIGTWGGAQYLSNPDHYLQLFNQVGSDNFASVIICEFEVPQRVTKVNTFLAPERFYGFHDKSFSAEPGGAVD